MNTLKVQTDALKVMYKYQTTGVGRAVMFDPMPDTPYVAIITSGYYYQCIAENDLVLDTNKCRETNIATKTYDSSNLRSYNYTGVIKRLSYPSSLAGTEVIELRETGTEKYIHIKLEFIKKFDKPENLRFLGRDDKSIVQVYDIKTDSFIGAVMPIIVSE